LKGIVTIDMVAFLKNKKSMFRRTPKFRPRAFSNIRIPKLYSPIFSLHNISTQLSTLGSKSAISLLSPLQTNAGLFPGISQSLDDDH
jgi:hypothetical protein